MRGQRDVHLSEERSGLVLVEREVGGPEFAHPPVELHPVHGPRRVVSGDDDRAQSRRCMGHQLQDAAVDVGTVDFVQVVEDQGDRVRVLQDQSRQPGRGLVGDVDRFAYHCAQLGACRAGQHLGERGTDVAPEA